MSVDDRALDAREAPSFRDLTLHVRPKHRKARLRAVLLAGVALLTIAASGYFGWQYWNAGR